MIPKFIFPSKQRMLINIALVIVFLVSLVIFFRWFERQNVWHPSFEATETPLSNGLEYEDVYYDSSDGVLLNGWYVPCKDAVASLLFCHGNGGNISWRPDSLKQFNSIGLNTFIFDYRGYGKSGGTLSEEGTYRDAEAAFAWLKKKTPEMPLILFGRSLGAAIATDLALKVKADALIFESGFTSIPDIGKKYFPFLPVRLLGTIRYDSLSKISKITVPLLVIHSPEDDIIPYAHGKNIFAAAPEPKQFYELKGTHNGGHFDSEKTYLPALRKFIDDYVIHVMPLRVK